MIVVKKHIQDSPVITNETVSFTVEGRDNYLTLFNVLKQQKIISDDCSFDDSVWKLFDGVDFLTLPFNFNEILFEKSKKQRDADLSFDAFILGVKSFVLYCIQSFDLRTVKIQLSAIKVLCNSTEYFTSSEIPNNVLQQHSVRNYFHVVVEFINYIEEINIDDDLYDTLEENYFSYLTDKRNSPKLNRSLPSFETMFKLNDIINDFTISSSGVQRELYFPIILWWKITTVIPLRARETVVIPIDCLEYEVNSIELKFYRTIAKSKKRHEKSLHSFEEKYKLFTYPITKEIANLIVEYRELVDKYDVIESFENGIFKDSTKRRFLFSIRSNYKFNRNQACFDIFKYNTEFFSERTLTKLLKRFLKEYVGEHLGNEFVPKTDDLFKQFQDINDNKMHLISLMDTRHFAIMNMVFMGIDPITVQHLVGHEDINSSYHYYSHIETFTNCFVVSIAKQKQRRTFTKSVNSLSNIALDTKLNNSVSNRRYNIIRADNDNLKSIDAGWCLYEKDDFIPCKLVLGNHNRCEYFKPKNDSSFVSKNEVNDINNEITTEISLIQSIVKEHKSIKEFKSKLQASTNRLQALAYQKANLINTSEL